MTRAKAVKRLILEDDCFRQSIIKYGVLFPVVMNQDGEVIDGNRRAEVATELGVKYDVEVVNSRTPLNVAHMLRENVQRIGAERDATLTHIIVGLASERGDDGVGQWPEEVIATTLGLSPDYVLEVMRRHLKPTERDVRDLFPPKRRRVDGSVGDAAVTTVDVEPLPAQTPQPPKLNVHEVLTFIPEVDAPRRGELRRSLEKDGQKTPILVTQAGLLVDGRARWEILQEMGVTPKVQEIDGNPWKAALQANADRFPSYWDRLTVLSKMPVRGAPKAGDENGVPTVAEMAQHFRVRTYSLRAFRILVGNGTPELVKAVTDEALKLGTALRMIREVPTDAWGPMIEAAYAEAEPPPPPTKAGPPPAPPRLPRGRVITQATVQTAIDALDALGMVMDASEGLDHRMTREQAAELMSRLSTARRPLGRLNTMLKQRKEAT